MDTSVLELIRYHSWECYRCKAAQVSQARRRHRSEAWVSDTRSSARPPGSPSLQHFGIFGVPSTSFHDETYRKLEVNLSAVEVGS